MSYGILPAFSETAELDGCLARNRPGAKDYGPDLQMFKVIVFMCGRIGM